MGLPHHYQSIISLLLLNFFSLVWNWSCRSSSFLLSHIVVLNIFIFCKFNDFFWNLAFLAWSGYYNLFLKLGFGHQDLTTIYSLIISANDIFRFKSNCRTFSWNLLKLNLILSRNSGLSRLPFSWIYYVITQQLSTFLVILRNCSDFQNLVGVRSSIIILLEVWTGCRRT